MGRISRDTATLRQRQEREDGKGCGGLEGHEPHGRAESRRVSALSEKGAEETGGDGAYIPDHLLPAVFLDTVNAVITFVGAEGHTNSFYRKLLSGDSESGEDN